MKKIFGTSAGSLAIIISATLALGATPVLAIHPPHAANRVQMARSECSDCHNSLQESPHFGSADWDVLAGHGLNRH